MNSSKFVLLINAREAIEEILSPIIKERGLTPLAVSAHDFLAAEYKFECGDVPTTGWINFPEHGKRIKLQSIAGSFAGWLNLDIDSDSMSQFEFQEILAFIAFVRQNAGRAVNPPNENMISTNCGSLPEQWETLRSTDASVRIPSWRLDGPANPPIRNDEIAVRDIMNPRLRKKNDVYENDKNSLLVEEPRGVLSSCAFVGQNQHHVRVSENGVEPVDVLSDTHDRFTEVIQALRRIYSLDYGEISYAYLGDVLFWSVAPHLPVEHAGKDSFQPLIERLVEEFTI
ncbi:hypothetical protein SAMN04487947_2393 [Halogeometricum rufum]|uniref:Uncharacterized protein n=1 Tax=Halogeometricum rufum TaxID=553469 RepID=A0A1I6HRZ6_9EURY|nr:hypothetical protein [Halogeometricum rufum]SFR57205.1 hypothetical protein SAMN04487947_2393 [Halogeometricum rufum]